MFKKHETIGVVTPSFSSQSSDGSTGKREVSEVKKKLYLKSKLCNDEKIIEMVRRLKYDSNRDISLPLRIIELPYPILPEPEEEENRERRRVSEDNIFVEFYDQQIIIDTASSPVKNLSIQIDTSSSPVEDLTVTNVKDVTTTIDTSTPNVEDATIKIDTSPLPVEVATVN